MLPSDPQPGKFCPGCMMKRLFDALHLDWIQSILIGPTSSPNLSPYESNNVLLGFFKIYLIFLGLVLVSMTLPCRLTPEVVFFRLLMFPFLLYGCLSIAIDCSITFGAAIFDCFWGVLLWNLGAMAVDRCLASVFLDREEKDRCPRWIVPKSQLHRFAGIELIPLPTSSTKDKKKEDGESSEHKGDDKAKAKVKDETNSSDALKRHGPSQGLRRNLPAIDKEWFLIPHSSYRLLSLRRLIWAIDNILTLRPTTSWIFPWEQRTLEWTHRSLLFAAENPDLSTYGKPENDHWLPIVCKVGVMLAALTQRHLLVIPPCEHFYYSTPLYQQAFNGLFYGVLISNQSAWFEYFAFPFFRGDRLNEAQGEGEGEGEGVKPSWLRRQFLLPITSLKPLMENPWIASGPSDFWGRRWHAFVRRVSWRSARLLPFGHTSPFLNKLYTFVVTGSLHGFMMARWYGKGTDWNHRDYPPTTLHALVFLLVPGPVAFFTLQGVAVALEWILFGSPPEFLPDARQLRLRRKQFHYRLFTVPSFLPFPERYRTLTWSPGEPVVKALARRALLWVGLAWTVRYFAGSLAYCGLHTIEAQRAGLPEALKGWVQ